MWAGFCLSAQAYDIPSWTLPKPVVWLVSWFNPTLALVYDNLGRLRNTTNTKSKLMLNIQYKSAEEAVLDCADSLIRDGLVPAPPLFRTWHVGLAVVGTLAAVVVAVVNPEGFKLAKGLW
jgi:hypothetical protein